MNGKLVGLAAGLLVLVSAVVYLLRTPAPEGHAATTPGPDRSGVARSQPLPAPSAAAGATEATPGSDVGERENGDGHAAAAQAPRAPAKDPRIAAREREFIARLLTPPGPTATDQERLAWEESPISDMLYPPGHACAGQPLDSTSPALLTAAGKDALARLIDEIPDVDVPQCLYEGSWNFHPLNQHCSSVDRDDLESVARCTHFLQTAQQDPKAYPASVWLPCLEGGQATTRRAYFEGILMGEVERVFAGPACTAN